MNIDYNKIQTNLNTKTKEILNQISGQYFNAMTDEQLYTIEWLLTQPNAIIVNSPNEQDLEFFNKQEGILNKEDYDIANVPSAHGGRTKEDNLIHVYPYAKSYSNCKNETEIIDSIQNDILVHEIFHYFIRPNIENTNDPEKEKFSHFLTEGLVQYYAEEFSQNNNLNKPYSNYQTNVKFAADLIGSLNNTLSKEEIDKCMFTLNYEQLLELSPKGSELYNEYCEDIQFHANITDFIVEICQAKQFDLNDKNIKGIIKHFEKENNQERLFQDLGRNIDHLFTQDDPNKEIYKAKLNNLNHKQESNEKER